MPSKYPTAGQAEAEFRAAFERLKLGRPDVLRPGVRVTQNNVAREAGKDPSALKKARFPGLVREIQEWVATAGGGAVTASPSVREQLKAARRKNRLLLMRIEELKRDRDLAQSKLMCAEVELLELWAEVGALRQGSMHNVVGIDRNSG
ncbi:hypothetical protein LY625_12890 [Lysobacter sp. GX 14042]|uniref:hypothetical protein n=1 Tax=Lysobacter sp. GX 14042 TaxID=2907155 RepID=UPI001F163FF3|nr:hypothetical protein [Lysobacter sp. GX 14042]MCE7033497.1 hypothetical protein [Lysobacter sp. GX 14042]